MGGGVAKGEGGGSIRLKTRRRKPPTRVRFASDRFGSVRFEWIRFGWIRFGSFLCVFVFVRFGSLVSFFVVLFRFACLVLSRFVFVFDSCFVFAFYFSLFFSLGFVFCVVCVPSRFVFVSFRAVSLHVSLVFRF